MTRPLVVAALAFALAPGCRGREGRGRGRDAAPVVVDARPPGRPLTAAVLDRLAAVSVPGAQVELAARGPADLALVVVGAEARATLTASACLTCTAPDLAAWEAHRPALEALWGAEAATGAADASLTIAALDAAGQPAISVDVRRGEGRPTAHLAHWNDGVTQLQVVCEAPPDRSAACPPLVAAILTAALVAIR